MNKEFSILIIMMLASFVSPFTSSSINLALPSIGKEFEADALLVGWGVLAFLIATGTFMIPMGRLSDAWGRKRSFQFGFGIFVLLSLAITFTGSMYGFVIIRALQGIANAIIFSTTMAILTLVFPPERRGWAIGLSSTAVYLGLSVGPAIGGWLNYWYGWRSIFYFTAILGSIIFLLSFKALKEEWSEGTLRDFDSKGAILYMITLVLLLFGLAELMSSKYGPVALFVSIILLYLLIRYEDKQTNPVLAIYLFKKNRLFSLANLASMINYSSSFAIGYVVSIYLQLVYGLNSQVAGFVMLIQSLVMAVLSHRTGALSDRYDAVKLTVIGMGFTSLGLFILALGTLQVNLIVIIVGLICAGVGVAFFAPPNNNAIMSCVEKSEVGIASASLGTSRLIGQGISLAIVAFIFAYYGGAVDIPLAELNPRHLGASITLILTILGIICLLWIIPSRARQKK